MARSFYAVIAEALLSQEPLPMLDQAQCSSTAAAASRSQAATHQRSHSLCLSDSVRSANDDCAELLNRLRNQDRSRRESARRRSPLHAMHVAMGRRYVLSPGEDSGISHCSIG